MILYRKHRSFPYTLEEAYTYDLGPAFREITITAHPMVRIESGEITISKGYNWDGPSGPAVDTPNFMRGSLVHDALYQLMREGRLDRGYREAADDVMARINKEAGMSWLRRRSTYRAVRIGGASSVLPDPPSEVLTAP